jgi:PAS domain S-box-containing protein
MTRYAAQPTQIERRFGEDDIIVSKTDATGRLTYANDVFLSIAGYGEEEVLGQPHSILRHPDMPRAVFKLLWDRIGAGKELFAYIKNMAKNGDHYWVLAHVTPTRDADGKIVGFHSNRRVPERAAIARVEPIYREVLAEEARHADRKAGLKAGLDKLESILAGTGKTYDEFVFSL